MPLREFARSGMGWLTHWRNRFVMAWSVAVGRRAAPTARDGVLEALGLLRHGSDRMTETLARLEDLARRMDQLEQAQTRLAEEGRRPTEELARRMGRMEQAQTRSSEEGRGLKRNFREIATPLYDSVIAATTSAGLKICIDGRDVGEGATLLAHGVIEPGLDRLMSKIVKPGGVFVDVGAQFGYYTLLAALLGGPRSKVYSFEPNPDLSSLIERSVRVNGYAKRVQLFASAASDGAGTAPFGFDVFSPGDGSLAQGRSSDPDPRGLEVDRARIDDLLNPGVVADCIKLDARGHEAAALRGMESLLRRSPGVILLLTHAPGPHRGDEPAATLLDELASLGLAVWRIGRSGFLEDVTREELRSGETLRLLAARRRPDDRALRWDRSMLQLADEGAERLTASLGGWLARGPELPLAAGAYEVAIEGDIEGELELTVTIEAGLAIAGGRITRGRSSLAFELRDDVRHLSIALRSASEGASLRLGGVLLRDLARTDV